MQQFQPDKSQTNVDFLAFSVARMEQDQRPVSAPSVAGSMPPEMADEFFKRLQFYRQQIHHGVEV